MAPSPRSAASNPSSKGRKTRRWAIAAGMALLVLLAVAYGTWWLAATDRLRAATLDWIEKRTSEGYRVGYAAIERSGFPLAARVVLSEPAIAGLGLAPAWSWSADWATVATTLLNPDRVALRALGTQRLGLLTGGAWATYEGGTKEMMAIVSRGDGLPAGALMIRDLALSGDRAGDAIGVASLEVAAKDGAEAPIAEQTTAHQVTLTASNLTLPDRLGLPFGGDVAHVAVDAKLAGPFELEPWPESLTEWREAGGTVEISRLEVTYGPLSLNAEGTLALDRNNQPEGAFTARVQGFRQTLDALRQKRLVDSKTADLAKLAVEALAQASGRDPSTVQAPLSVQNQTLFVGPIPLLSVPEIQW